MRWLLFLLSVFPIGLAMVIGELWAQRDIARRELAALRAAQNPKSAPEKKS